MEEKELRRIIREEFAAILRDAAVCPLPEWATPEMGHYAGMIRDIGDGSMSRGIEEMRENHKLIGRMRQGIGTAGKALVTALAMGALSAVIWGLVALGKFNVLDRLK